MSEEPRLSPKLIEAFRQIMVAGSLSGAARSLGTSQPQMTRLLHELERETQLVLFLRHRRGITPTREAELLHEEVNRAFLGLRDIARAAREIRDFARGAISVATNPAGAFELVPGTVAAFAGSHRDVRISVQVQPSHQTMDGVRNGRVDLGLISPLEPVTGVAVVARWHMPYVVIVRADDPRGRGRQMLDISDFEPQSLVVPDPTYLAARGASPATAARIQKMARLNVPVSYAAAAMVLQGMDAALVDPITGHFFASRLGLRAVPLRDAPVYELILVRPKQQAFSAMNEAFSRVLGDRIEELAGAPNAA